MGASIRAELPEVEAAARAPDRGAADVAGPRFGRRARIGAVAAAAIAAVAAVLAGIVLVPNWRIESLRHGPDDSDTVVPRVEEPSGDVEVVDEFLWQPVTSADLYQVTLYDAAGNVVWETETPEIQAALPDSIRLESGALYLWQVAARVGWDRWVNSELVRFRLAEP